MSTLTPKQFEAIRLLVQGETLTDTAEKIGVDRKTIQNWRKPGTLFSQSLDELIESLNQHWANQIKLATQNSLQFLNELIADKSAPQHLRLKAALAVLNRDKKAGWPQSINKLHQENSDSKEPISVHLRSSVANIEVPEISQISPQSQNPTPSEPDDKTNPAPKPTPRRAPCPAVPAKSTNAAAAKTPRLSSTPPNTLIPHSAVNCGKV